jgi:hypothetical protein
MSSKRKATKNVESKQKKRPKLATETEIIDHMMVQFADMKALYYKESAFMRSFQLFSHEILGKKPTEMKRFLRLPTHLQDHLVHKRNMLMTGVDVDPLKCEGDDRQALFVNAWHFQRYNPLTCGLPLFLRKLYCRGTSNLRARMLPDLVANTQQPRELCIIIMDYVCLHTNCMHGRLSLVCPNDPHMLTRSQAYTKLLFVTQPNLYRLFVTMY